VTILTVDFETLYDRDYSLSKMTTEEYIRDPRFEVIGVSVKIDEQPAEWFSGTRKQTKAWLDQFPWDKSVAIAHNAMFDMAIMNWRFDIRPKRIMDTLSMARAIDGPDAGNSLAKLAERHGLGVKGNEVINALGKRRLDFTPQELAAYGEYCINDTELTYKLAMKLLEGFPKEELQLIDLTMRMFVEPVLALDKTALEAHLVDVQEKKRDLLGKALIDKDNLMSNPRLAETLRNLGVEPPMKVSPTTGKDTYAFAKNDEEFKALLEHENPIVQAIVAARLGVKSTLEESRTERFIGIADRGTLPVPLRYYGAHTGRWSGQDSVNLQNLPRKSPLKAAVKAPKGYVIIDSDSSQIECRTVAFVAGQWDLVETFSKNNEEMAAGVPKPEWQHDPYKLMASELYGVPMSAVTADQRQVGKVVLLGSQYGLGWKKFMIYAKQQGIEVDEDFAKRTIAVYRERFPYIPAIWRAGDEALECIVSGYATTLGVGLQLDINGAVVLPNGLRIPYLNLRYYQKDNGKYGLVYDTKKGRSVVPKNIWGGGLTENWGQALARIVIANQMLMISRRYKVAMTVHDSVVVVVPQEEADEARTFVEQCMRIRPKWAAQLPLNCESKMGPSYGG
jgi:DNA polymerase I-like protein with 3'-5' exonuclease and polymerase domains